jgi:hypothetical protein
VPTRVYEVGGVSDAELDQDQDPCARHAAADRGRDRQGARHLAQRRDRALAAPARDRLPVRHRRLDARRNALRSPDNGLALIVPIRPPSPGCKL